MKKVALITGTSGQDGSILAEFLLSKGYELLALLRNSSDKSNLQNLLNNSNFKIIYGDLMNEDLLRHILSNNQIDEIYNLASQSNVRLSYDHPRQTFEVTLIGTISLIESVKHYSPKSKIFQAGSSAMFGKSCDIDGFQRENTPFNPISPYASSKLFAHNICQNYRRNQGLYIVNGILYNHESSKNKRNSGILKTIVEKAVLIKNNKLDKFYIPNIKLEIDFGHAKDYIEAMWLCMQQKESDDYIISSGKAHSIEYVCEYVFSKLNMNYKDFIISDDIQVIDFIAKGDPSKIKNIGWSNNFTFENLIDEIIDFEINKNKITK